MALAMLLILSNNPRTVIFLCSGLYGLAMSAIYPLLMSMPSYLKYKMSAKDTSQFVVAGAIGESLVPVLVGYGISYIGPNSLFSSSLIYSCVALYLFSKIMAFEQTGDQDLGVALMNKKYSAPLDN